MIQIAICDDEPVMCRLLKEKLTYLLKAQQEPFSITCYTSSLDLLIAPIAYELIFLDIRMPGVDGMEAAKQLREPLPETVLIFVTVFKDYMPEAFQVEAFGYLIKPIENGCLSLTLERALRKLKRTREPHLFVRTLNQYRSIAYSSIFYCEVINRKLYLHAQDGLVEYYGKMDTLEKQLDNRFFRCHRSYLVNLDYLKTYSDGQILLQDESRIPVSRLRHREFMNAMLQYMSPPGREK